MFPVSVVMSGGRNLGLPSAQQKTPPRSAKQTVDAWSLRWKSVVFLQHSLCQMLHCGLCVPPPSMHRVPHSFGMWGNCSRRRVFLLVPWTTNCFQAGAQGNYCHRRCHPGILFGTWVHTITHLGGYCCMRDALSGWRISDLRLVV